MIMPFVAQISAVIGIWCEIDNNKIPRDNREMCMEYILNCALDLPGKLTEDEDRLKLCVERGQARMGKKFKLEDK